MSNDEKHTSFLTGDLVRLVALDPERDAALIASWSRDPWYDRLFGSDPAYPAGAKGMRAWMENFLNEAHGFLVETVAEARPVGWADISGFDWVTGNCWVGIGLGKREDWGRGYGTDAMRILLRYAFKLLNMNRVTLSTFEYNPRAIRSYEKIGFQHEGRARQALVRGGQCWDMLYMGILRSEWETLEVKNN